MKYNLSNIMKMAWTFVKQTGLSLSECLKKAWANAKLVGRLKSGIVKFHFQKVNGEIREAWGTLQNLGDKIKGDKRSTNPTIQVYWDTQKEAFRCFKKLNLIALS